MSSTLSYWEGEGQAASKVRSELAEVLHRLTHIKDLAFLHNFALGPRFDAARNMLCVVLHDLNASEAAQAGPLVPAVFAPILEHGPALLAGILDKAIADTLTPSPAPPAEPAPEQSWRDRPPLL